MSGIRSWIPDPSQMRLVQKSDGIEVTFDRPAGGRVCGSCQLCCKLLPVPDLGKGANTRCQFQKVNRGCVIYARRPNSCRLFSCRWLIDGATAGLKRPDRSGYVIDPMLDKIHARNSATGEMTPIPVIQIWVDPNHPDAHRDAALRGYLSRMAEQHGIAALARYGSKRAISLFAPAFDAAGEWHEVESLSEADLPALA
jgi:hypothetical protein